MKKALLVMLIGYISMVTIVSRAHGDEVNSCHLQLAGQVTVSTDRLLVTDAAGRRLEITRDNQVLLNDSAIQIDAGDRQAVANYQEQVRTVIPVIVDLALDAVEIGVESGVSPDCAASPTTVELSVGESQLGLFNPRRLALGTTISGSNRKAGTCS